MRKKLYIDGSGWNSVRSAICVCGAPEDLFVYVVEKPYTNNEAEYLSFLKAAEMAENEAVIITDSQLLEKQLNGEYKVKSDKLKPFFEKAKKIKDIKKLSVQWVERENNKAGVLLDIILKKGFK